MELLMLAANISAQLTQAGKAPGRVAAELVADIEHALNEAEQQLDQLRGH